MPRRINPTVDAGTHRRQADTKQEKNTRDHYRALKERLMAKFLAEREAEEREKEKPPE